MTVFAHLVAPRCAQLVPFLTVTEPDTLGVWPGNSRSAATCRSLELTTTEEAALVAGHAPELPPLTSLRMLRLRAGTLVVAHQTQIQRTSYGGELQQGDLGPQIDPQWVIQRIQQIIGKGQVPHRRRFRAREVIGGDILTRLGRMGKRLPVGAPLAHTNTMARTRALENETAATLSISGNSRKQAYQNRHEQQPPEHPRIVEATRQQSEHQPSTSTNPNSRHPDHPTRHPGGKLLR